MLIQYGTGLKTVIQMVTIAMASYDRWYSANKEDPIRQILQSLWKGSKYIQGHTQRGIKVADLTSDCAIYFTRAFWSIVEQDAFKVCVYTTLVKYGHERQ